MEINCASENQNSFFVLEDGVLLKAEVSTAPRQGDVENEVVFIQWCNEAGIQCATAITEEGMDNAILCDGHRFTFEDKEGDEICLQVATM